MTNDIAYLGQLKKQEAEIDRLKAENERLTEIIESTASVLDTECPDIGAYPDGHCSLVEGTELLTAEVAKLRKINSDVSEMLSAIRECDNINITTETKTWMDAVEKVNELQSQLKAIREVASVDKLNNICEDIFINNYPISSCRPLPEYTEYTEAISKEILKGGE